MSSEGAQTRLEIGNEDRYRALLRSLSTFVWVADAQGVFNTPQAGWEEYTGHGFDRHGGNGWIADVHPDDRAHIAEIWKRAVESKSWYEAGWRCWHSASQGWRQCITRGVPVLDSDGFVREWIGAVLDIEDRVDAELKRVQNDLVCANRELSSNLEAMSRLQQLSSRLVPAGELNALLGEILETALDLTGAHKGNIQLFQRGALRIFEQRGFDAAFLDFFNNVEHGRAACGTAMAQKRRVIVENVADSPIFAGTEALDVLLAADVRAVQSTPLFSRSGELLGMFSTHYANRQAPSEHDIRIVDILARQAADVVERSMTEARQAKDLAALTTIHELSGRVVDEAGLEILIQEIMDAAINVVDAERGTLQLIRDGALRIIAQHGHTKSFLDYFGSADSVDSVCGESLKRGERVVVPDVEASPIFAGSPSLPVLRAAGVRAVQSTPLFSRNGSMLGILTTQWSMPHEPDQHDLWRLDLLVRQAADLIERNTTEQARKRAKEALDLSLKVGKAGTFDWDARRDINRWSDELLELYGIKREEFGESSNDWRAALFPEDSESAIAALERSLQTGQFEQDFRIVRRDNGEVRWMHGAGRVFFDGGKPIRMLGMNIDVTAQKSAEERLKQSQAQFQRLVESNIVGIVIANEQRVVDANDVYLRMLGCSREDLLAGRADWVKATPPDSYQKDLHALREMRERGLCEPYEKEYIRPDGSRIPILIGVAALPGYAELTWICVVLDLSEQKRLQNALQSTNEQLLRANKDLEQFAYSASHDLQEPLRSIKIYSELLTMLCKEKLEGEALQALDFVQAGATRMELLLRGLLSYTQASEFESPTESIDAGNALKTALENLDRAISESGARITAGALPSVRIHNTQLEQLFQNLVGNAIKYRKPGVRPVIHVAAEECDGQWRFAVRDNGIGIEDEYRERVFGLFKRLHTQNEYTGTGIGLALCQRIIEHHGGRIWVESQPGEGSTFYFTLPA